MKKTLTAAMLVGLGAASASAQLNGSDTLFEVINDPTDGILANCPGAAGLTYLGGGSSVGEGNMRNNVQEIAPMSRFLTTNAATCRTPQSGCFLGALDAVSVLANQAKTDGVVVGDAGAPNAPSGNNVACDAANFGRTLPSGFVVNDWRTALRIVYAGYDAQITTADPCAVNAPSRTVGTTTTDVADPAFLTLRCNSSLRQELVNNWDSIFQTGCTDNCQALKHAFRRDDFSGTTDVFLELLALPNINNSATPPVAQRPFCNGLETEDRDPVRRTCTGNGRTAFDGEQVCQADGTLGIVLPVLVPPRANDPYLTLSAAGSPPPDTTGCNLAFEPSEVAPLCNPNSALGGTFQRISNPPGITTCPIGALVGGTCIWPKRQGSAAGTGFNCVNGKGNLPGSVPSSTDGRAWNLFPRKYNGSPVTYTRPNTSGGTSTQTMRSAFYRIHTISQQPGGDRPTETVAGRVVSKACSFVDATDQIGCLVEASPCSIGFAGLSASNPDALCGSPRRALALRAPLASGGAVAPSATTVRRFLEPAGSTCSTGTSDFDIRYPLSRALWLCTVDGVPASDGTGVTTGTQTSASLSQQSALAACFAQRTNIDRAVASNFITLDDNGSAPVSFRQCSVP